MSTEKIIELLEKGDRKKRKEAFITEFFFQNQIIPKIASEGAMFTFGWIYLSEFNSRRWFKVQDFEKYNDKERWIDRAIIKKIVNDSLVSNDFYFIDFTFDFSNHINLKLRLFEPDFEKGKYLNRDPENILNIDSVNTELKKLIDTGSNENTLFNWIENFPISHLELLLAQRLVINHGFKGGRFKNPIDIDAIEFVADDKPLTFIEFKRKNPCNSYLFNRTQPQSTVNLLDIQKDLRGAIEVNSITTRAGVHKLLLDRGYSSDKELKYYGLDMSHYKNFRFISDMGSRYIYLIWHSLIDKPTLVDLFQNIETPTNVELYCLELSHSNFTGFTYTIGSDSGSFSNGFRLQATVKAPKDRYGVINKESKFKRILY